MPWTLRARLRTAVVSGLSATLLGGLGVQPSVAAPAPPLVRSAATSDACGPLRYKPNGAPWACQFAEHFDGDALNPAYWNVVRTAQTGFRSGRECYKGGPRNVRVADGRLSLTVLRTRQRFLCRSPKGDYTTRFTAGYVTTWGRFARTYGRFAIRARFPATKVRGVHSALWLWPQDAGKYGPTWPSSGEIDIAEFFSYRPARVVPYVHYPGDADDPHATNGDCVIVHPERFHNYVLTWTASTITLTYDGKICTSTSWQPAAPLAKPQPFDHPFTINLTQALGIGDNSYVRGTTPLPATMQVTSVRVWQ